METLLDTSWTLHCTSTNSALYRKLFRPSMTQAHLARYFDRLPDFITSQKPQYVDDLNSDSEKIGSLRDCRYSISSLDLRASTIQLISITLQYQNSAFHFVLATPHLVLSKAPASQTKLVSTFLIETFDLSLDPLRLPSSFLSTSLQDYITTLTSPFSASAHHDDLAPERRAAALKAAIGTLKLTISFSGPVAPHLKTLDLSIPYDTVDTLESSTKVGGNNFMERLAHHLHLQTGLRLPLTASTGEPDSPSHARADDGSGAEPPLKLSKVATAAFAVSIEGRLRFAEKAIENAGESEALVEQANARLLESVIEEAKTKGTTRERD